MSKILGTLLRPFGTTEGQVDFTHFNQLTK